MNKRSYWFLKDGLHSTFSRQLSPAHRPDWHWDRYPPSWSFLKDCNLRRKIWDWNFDKKNHTKDNTIQRVLWPKISQVVSHRCIRSLLFSSSVRTSKILLWTDSNEIFTLRRNSAFIIKWGNWFLFGTSILWVFFSWVFFSFGGDHDVSEFEEAFPLPTEERARFSWSFRDFFFEVSLGIFSL